MPTEDDDNYNTIGNCLTKKIGIKFFGLLFLTKKSPRAEIPEKSKAFL